MSHRKKTFMASVGLLLASNAFKTNDDDDDGGGGGGGGGVVVVTSVRRIRVTHTSLFSLESFGLLL